MVDSVLLLVDAVDGPMPQTRFVTQKAFAHGLRPIVVINKIDREEARPHWVLDQTFDLFDQLGATEAQLDFPVVYASALQGFAGNEPDQPAADMTPLFEAIVKHCPPPDVDENGPLQLQVSQLDYSSYVGAIGIGRIKRGKIRRNSPVVVVDRERQGAQRAHHAGAWASSACIASRWTKRARATSSRSPASSIPRSPTRSAIRRTPEALPPLVVDEPTISMTFEVNNSPFCGRDGKYVTSRQIRERLLREALTQRRAARRGDRRSRTSSASTAAASCTSACCSRTCGAKATSSRYRGRASSSRKSKAQPCEPYETLAVDLDESSQGAIMQALGERGGQLTGMHPDGKGRVRLDYVIPSRGLIGFQTEFRTLTSGTGILHHIFDHFGPLLDREIGQRTNGVLISNAQGKVLAYALFNLQERGRLMAAHGDEVYEGQIVGIHSRDNDLVVNPLKGKKLTNIRAAGRDENIILVPPIRYTLEQAMEFIADDELVEVTPTQIRLRKRALKEHERKRAGREEETAE